MPSITQVKYILAVDRHGHFGVAAKHCRVAQPSLSTQIQKVEEEIGFAIFDRGHKPVVATDKGRRFMAQARQLMAEYDRLLQVSSEESETMRGDLRLGIIPTVLPYLVPSFIHSFAHEYPQVTVHLEERPTRVMIEALLDDQLDAGILATPVREAKGLRQITLYYEPLYVYVSRKHVLAEKTRIGLRDLRKNDIWLLRDGNCLRDQTVNLCNEFRSTSPIENVQFEGGSLETLRQLILKGSGYTVVPSLFASTLTPGERQAMVREFTPPTPAREISLLYRRDRWKSDLVQALVSTIKSSLPGGLLTQPSARMTVLPVSE